MLTRPDGPLNNTPLDFSTGSMALLALLVLATFLTALLHSIPEQFHFDSFVGDQ